MLYDIAQPAPQSCVLSWMERVSALLQPGREGAGKWMINDKWVLKGREANGVALKRMCYLSRYKQRGQMSRTREHSVQSSECIEAGA